MTFSHISGRLNATQGFGQRVALPSNPASKKLASFHSTQHDALVTLAFGTTTYTVPLPANAVITEVKYLQGTAFSGGTSPSIQVGSAAAGTDMMPSTALSASFRALPSKFTIPGSSADGQTLFITITGVPTAGAGVLVVTYANPAVANADGGND